MLFTVLNDRMENAPPLLAVCDTGTGGFCQVSNQSPPNGLQPREYDGLYSRYQRDWFTNHHFLLDLSQLMALAVRTNIDGMDGSNS
jgi:hypothetical protein